MALVVQGLAELDRKLKAIPAKVEARTRAAMEKGAKEIVEMAKRLVPVDQGDLRDSIQWKWGEPPKGSFVFAKSNPTLSGLKVSVYASDYKARWIEFGTIKMTAQPFFFPSYRALRKRVKSRIMREMRKGLKAQ